MLLTAPQGESARHCYSVTSLRDRSALDALIPEWEDLAGHALEPNVFHEPWMLLPALEAFAEPFAVQLVLVRAGAPGSAPLLCGVFPLERAVHIRGLPYPHLRVWRHRHCMLGAPLVRAGHARETLEALFDWLARDPRGASVLEWGVIPGDGPFHRALDEVLSGRGHERFVLEQHLRGLLGRARAPRRILPSRCPATRARNSGGSSAGSLSKARCAIPRTARGSGTGRRPGSRSSSRSRPRAGRASAAPRSARTTPTARFSWARRPARRAAAG